MAKHLDEVFDEDRQRARHIVSSEHCLVANSVTEPGDDVYVTLPNSEAPAERVLVAFWRMGVDLDVGGDLVPRFPTRGHQGVAVHLDTGEICLIF